MSPTLIVSLSGCFLGVCGVIAAAIISKERDSNPGDNPGNNPGDAYVRAATFNAVIKGLSESLDALRSDNRDLSAKVDKMLMHFKIS